MSRTPIFEGIRSLRTDKTFDPGEIVAIDTFLDSIGVPRDHGRAPSPMAVAFVRGQEGLERKRADGRIEAYMPTPKDVPTIGFGSTGPDIRMGTIWTVAQCEARFASTLNAFAGKVDGFLGTAPTTQGQFDAMVSLAYNIGAQAFHDSTLLRLHKEGDYAGAAAQFGRWNKQAGVVLNGLTKRRAAEARIYQGLAA